MAPTIGQFLLKAGVINKQQLEEAIQAQVIYGGKLGTNLVELGFVDIATLSRVLAKKFSVPTIDHTHLKPCPKEVLKLFGKKTAQKYEAVPLTLEGGRLDVLMTNPDNLAAIDEMGFTTGKRIKPYVAPELIVTALMEKYYGIKRDYRPVQWSMRGAQAPSGQKKKGEAAGDLSEGDPGMPKPVEREKIKGLDLGKNEELTTEADFQEMILSYHSTHEEALAEESQPASPSQAQSPAIKPAPPPPPPPPPPSPKIPVVKAAAPPPPLPFPETVPTIPEDVLDLEEMVREPPKWDVKEHRKTADAMQETAIEEEEPEEEIEIIEELPEALSLAEAVQRLKEVTNRDELSQVVLAFALSFFKRSALFVTRGGMALGWDGMGGTLNRKTLQGIMLPLNAPSIFKTVHDNSAFFLGAIPKTQVNERFLKLMGNERPASVFLIPILFHGQVVNILYGDNGQGQNAPFDISDLLILAPKVPQAFEDLILRKKRDAAQQEG